MAAISAAICLWRRSGAGSIEVLIVHPGGPYWAKKDAGAWSLPKGEYDPDTEDGLTAARREFAEEIGQPPPESGYLPLGDTRLKSGKVINAWASEDGIDKRGVDADAIVSNTFEIEWPPRSGKRQSFPEVDRALWAADTTARDKLNPAQVVFLDRLLEAVHDNTH